MANNYTPSYNQYLTQSAGYALPSSVRTYSVFDPASNTWRRMTNDGMSPMPQGNQADIAGALAQARQTRGTVYPAEGMGQGQPVEMHPGYLNPPVQASAQAPSRSSRTTRNTKMTVNPVVVNGEQSLAAGNAGMTPSGIEFVNGQPVSLDRTQNIPSEYDGEIRNLNNVPTSSGIVGQPVVNVNSADIGQSVPIREATPRLNLNGYIPPTPGEANWGRALGGAATAAVVPAIAGATLMYGPAAAGAALGLGRTALSSGLNLGRTALTSGLGTVAKVLPKNITSRISSLANSAVDTGKNLFNRLGGFLQRPAPTAQTYTKVRPVHNMVNPNVKRSANYYGH